MTKNNEPLVLLVDDREDVIHYYKQQLLETYNISTMSATTLKELDEKFDEYSPEIDVIILDGCMPGDDLNTVDFITRARAEGFAKPIIAASGSPLYRQLMFEAGCSHKSEKQHAPGLAWMLVACV